MLSFDVQGSCTCRSLLPGSRTLVPRKIRARASAAKISDSMGPLRPRILRLRSDTNACVRFHLEAHLLSETFFITLGAPRDHHTLRPVTALHGEQHLLPCCHPDAQPRDPSRFSGPLLRELPWRCSLLKPFRQQMVRDANGVGDDRQRRIDRTCRHKTRSIDDIEIVQIMSLAMRVEHAGRRIRPHAASAVLVADTLQRDTLLEIRVQRNRSRRMPGPLEYVDPAVFEAIERFHIIRCVRELNPPGCGVRNRLGLVGVASVSGGMGSSPRQAANSRPIAASCCAG